MVTTLDPAVSVPTVAVAPLNAPVIVSDTVKSVAPNPAVRTYLIGETVEITLATALELPPVIFSPLRKVPTRLLIVNCGAAALAVLLKKHLFLIVLHKV